MAKINRQEELIPAGYIGIGDVSTNSDVSVLLVGRNYERIPGYIVSNGNAYFPRGSRYPFNMGSSKINTPYGRQKAVLRALSKGRYIDSSMLRIDEDSFRNLLDELVRDGLVVSNDSKNQYGANGYDLTISGGQFVDCLPKMDSRISKALSAGDNLSAILSTLGVIKTALAG